MYRLITTLTHHVTSYLTRLGREQYNNLSSRTRKDTHHVVIKYTSRYIYIMNRNEHGSVSIFSNGEERKTRVHNKVLSQRVQQQAHPSESAKKACVVQREPLLVPATLATLQRRTWCLLQSRRPAVRQVRHIPGVYLSTVRSWSIPVLTTGEEEPTP